MTVLIPISPPFPVALPMLYVGEYCSLILPWRFTPPLTSELYKFTYEWSPPSPDGPALWFAVVLCCVLCGIMLLV